MLSVRMQRGPPKSLTRPLTVGRTELRTADLVSIILVVWQSECDTGKVYCVLERGRGRPFKGFPGLTTIRVVQDFRPAPGRQARSALATATTRKLTS